MINILSIGCSLAFAPYLLEGAAEFVATSRATPRVVRQGGSGLTVRSDGELDLRYQGHESLLNLEDARHYAATLEPRVDAYHIRRMTDEVVISSFRNCVVLSHPQSELWLEPEVTAAIVQAASQKGPLTHLPEWLSYSIGGGGLLLSDRRSGRWVLLGSDHVAELERRLIPGKPADTASSKPPTIDLKGITIHLQSALQLATTFEDFSNNGSFVGYREVTPRYSLGVSRSSDELELRDTNNRVVIGKREAKKWASWIAAELDRLAVVQFDRGRIRTVFADVDDGRWVLQWGDEVLYPNEAAQASRPLLGQVGEFTTLLDVQASSCVALTDSEAALLRNR